MEECTTSLSSAFDTAAIDGQYRALKDRLRDIELQKDQLLLENRESMSNLSRERGAHNIL